MSRRPGSPEDVYFPVVPMLDMAFQLLAFFILTFQAPTGETWLDLDLPIAAVCFPNRPRMGAGEPRADDLAGFETRLVVRAEADRAGLARAAHSRGCPAGKFGRAGRSPAALSRADRGEALDRRAGRR